MPRRTAYFLIAFFLLAACVWIFFYSRGFIRNHGGDFCIVILIYAAVKSVFCRMNPFLAGSGVFLFAAGVEFLQSAYIPAHFNTSSSLVAATLGSTFDRMDILAYLAGSAAISLFDHFILLRTKHSSDQCTRDCR